MNTKTPKPRLQDMEPRELRDLCRELRSQRDGYKDRAIAAEDSAAMLAHSEALLQEENAALSAVNDELSRAYSELKEQYDLAVINNSKVMGVLESTGIGDEVSLIADGMGMQIIERLDIIIGIMSDSGADYPQDTDDAEEESDDDLGDFDDADYDGDADADEAKFQEAFPDADSSPDEDDYNEDDEFPPVIGADTHVEGETRADAVITAAEDAIRAEGDAAEEQPDADSSADVSEAELTAIVSPAIKAVVDGFANYEDKILTPVRDGSLSKELALRTIVAQVYPQHPEMAETIITARSTRDAVYAIMGL